jgi:hypothetical protein
MWQTTFFRKIYEPVTEQGAWKSRNNQEVRELYKSSNWIAVIKMRRLTDEIDQTGVARNFFLNKSLS